MENTNKGLMIPKLMSMGKGVIPLILSVVFMLIIIPMMKVIVDSIFMLPELWMIYSICYLPSLLLLVLVWRIPLSDKFFKNIGLYLGISGVLALFIYAFLFFFYSLSPALRNNYFALSHPSWLQSKDIQVLKTDVYYDFVPKGTNYTYLDILYGYHDNAGGRHIQTEKKAYRVYRTFAHMEDSEVDKAQLNNQIPDLLAQHPPVIFYNSKAPEESRLFLGNQLFDVRQVSYFSYDLIFFGLLTVIFFIAGLLSKIKIKE
ncbi:Uncharacterised protein [Sphingobacterium spiritivorum]|uniref:Uncharacterized protein n=1 Tax=Sphingobacterium spiritivorum TaxID=258 RepID=A0A380CR60_SPHSI|nr:hypothetical protein [Sphingobacterium spiritivorum]SUJ26916.1 Uncharacterised protein [Sphingobacterium spiritivorum]